ncbi:hypothetical protein COLO4_10248 [Corchorus olitorius]|uniref:Uncharacterized protein n=1 Tax=Corchorus olitorius TaxID=93759 RepID=A0A1R3K9F3_9ROSI|nr:hypothetical protein COLO4_10248 [Corchorus olitorius]
MLGEFECPIVTWVHCTLHLDLLLLCATYDVLLLCLLFQITCCLILLRIASCTPVDLTALSQPYGLTCPLNCSVKLLPVSLLAVLPWISYGNAPDFVILLCSSILHCLAIAWFHSLRA